MADISFRTAEELNDPAFNYFLAYKIDPNETDKAKIEPIIKKAMSDTKGGLESRRLLELKTDIMEIMCNDSTYNAQTGTYKPNSGGRAQEAKAAKKLKLKETVDVIQRLCQTRKTILKSEIKGLCDKANTPVAFFTEAELDAAIKPLLSIIKIIDNLDSSIPFDKYQKTDQLLKAQKKADLYDFLGCKPTDSSAEIQNKSDEQYKNSQKGSDLKKKQAVSALCALVKELILSSPQSKKYYDYYLALRDDIFANYEIFKSNGIKEIEFETYLKNAQTVVDTLHISSNEAETILAVALKFYQLTLIGNNTGDLEFCPYPGCGMLFKKGAKSCPHCGKPLEVVCWNCRQTTPLTKDDRGCPTCGATQHAHDVFVKKCGALDSLFARPNVTIPELETALLDIKNVVPNYQSRADSTIAKKVQDYNKQVGEIVDREKKLGEAYKADVAKTRELIAQKKYQTAFGVARSLQTKYGSYNLASTQKIVADINAVLATAQKQIEMAKAYAAQRNEAAAIAAAAKALEICEDYNEARQILQKFPPKPVTNLRATLNGNKVLLEWDDRVKQDFTSYTIIKKVGVAPVNADDGALVDKGLSIKFFEDENIIPATPYYYSVYVDRGGIKSPLCTTMTPVLLYTDVSNVQQEFVTSGIKVSWETPKNIKNIEVWKKDGPVAPLKAGDGTKVVSDGKGFYDEKCTGETSYLIICNYQVKDKVVQSRGVKVVFKPFEKTSPLENVNIEPIGPNKYVFTCNEGYTGNVSLYYSNTKLPIQTNTVLKYIDFTTICKGLTKIATSPTVDGKISFIIPQDKIGMVYPIVATDQLFVVSPPHLVNTITGMNASHTVNNGTVRITGALHPKASNLIVKVSHSKYADKMTDAGENFTFKKEEYTKRGFAEVHLQTNTINYITLFVEFVEDGIKTYSQPVKLNPPIDHRESVNVHYCLEYTATPAKPFKVTITFESNIEVEVPALVLMKGRPVPLNKNEGELCERLEPLKLKKGFLSKKYTGKHIVTVTPTATTTKFAVFLSEDGGHVAIIEVPKL